MCKWLFAAILSCATCVCLAEGDPVGEYLMYWMVDYSGKAGDMAAQVAEKAADGWINLSPNTGNDFTANDFNWSRLVAVVNGEKVTVGAAELVDLKAGTEADPLVADLRGVSGPITSFAVEFFNYSNGSLSLLGWTESITPDELLAQGKIADFRDPKYPQASYDVWSPKEFAAVPEPTSGLLLLIGGALLALRRKQRKDVEG
ncbi:MAG: PEP-CTERM sorting domain-containing protein [Kiritimatiellia bacterium]